jgi:hypothetical protein
MATMGAIMLVTFHSNAAADVIMVGRDAQKALDLLGKTISQGSLGGTELDHAIGVLENATAESKQHEPSQAVAQDAASQREIFGERHFHEARDDVNFAARVFPLLELMRAARKSGSDLAWGS